MQIMEGTTERLDSESLDRRRFLKRAAHVSWSVPLIITALAGPAHATHLTVGSACNTATKMNHCGTGMCCCGCVGTGCCPSTQSCGTAAGLGAQQGLCCWPTGGKVGTTNCGTVDGQANSACCSGRCGGGLGDQVTQKQNCGT